MAPHRAQKFSDQGAVALYFRNFTRPRAKRQALLERLGVDSMPPVLAVMDYTEVYHVVSTAAQCFDQGAPMVLIPVGRIGEDGELSVKTLIGTREASESFWSIRSSQLHATTPMGDVVMALDPHKVWDMAAAELPVVSV